MMLSGKGADKLLFTTIYVVVAVLVVVQGARAIANFALDASFYNNWLRFWQVQLVQMRYRTIVWPAYDRQDPAVYMETLVRLMQREGLTPPGSNTGKEYLYRLSRFGQRSVQLLLVCTREQIVIFNLPESTFRRIDRFVDGNVSPETGQFTGSWSADGMTRIAVWKV